MWMVRCEEMAEGGGVPSCMYLLGAMGTALAVLCGVIVYLAKRVVDEMGKRIAERDEVNAELSLMLKAANEKKGGG